MKKQITIIVLLSTCFFSWSQQFVKITTPCSDEFLRNVPGRWIHLDALNAKISKPQQHEILNRLDKIHQFVFNIYPSPVGIDAVWSRFTTDEEFAYQVRVDHFPGGKTNESLVNGIPVVMYSYNAFFCQYSCGRDKYEMMAGYPRESGAQVNVAANTLSFLPRSSGGPKELKIDEREIRMMPVIKGKWKEYTLYTPETGSGATMVLLHRDGMLPYTPVSRKQYLDLSIRHFINLYDKMIADVDKNAKAFVDAGMADTKSLKEGKEKLDEQKKDVLKHYQDELAATTASGLLDAPAIIPGPMCYPISTSPVFTTEKEGGRLLVTENPAYIRKDLPKYIPQFFVLSLEKTNWPITLKVDPLKAVEESFPIEKLQAMIDK